MSLATFDTSLLGDGDAPPGHYTIKNGTVYDTKTKLTWQRSISQDSFTWSEAQSHCNDLMLDGTGWRVPSMKELQTIVDDTKPWPSIDTNAFPDKPDSDFWTSSRTPDNPALAWQVNFGHNITGVTTPTPMMVECSVRCVR